MASYKPKAALINKPLTINVTAPGMKRIRRASRAAGMTISAWARGILLKAAGRVK